jgi:hypothetical protein
VSEFITVIAVSAIIAYVIGRQLTGEPLRGRRVVLLPAVLTVIGLLDLGGDTTPVRPVDVACLVVGGIVVAGIGVAQGAFMHLESRNGSLWGRLPVTGLWLWLLLIVSRIAMTVVADGLDAKAAASSSTILLMLGISRLGQAAVVVPRALVAGIPFASEKDGKTFLAGHTGPTAPTGMGQPAASDRRVGMDWPAMGRQVGTYVENRHRDR